MYLRMSTLLLLFILSGFVHESLTTDTYATETSLRAALKSGYDKEARPSSPTTVSSVYNIRALLQLDIAAEIMQVAGWFTYVWTDNRLTWTPATYGDISALEVDWTLRPKFIVSNGIDDAELFGLKDSVVRVTYNGTCQWKVPGMLSVTCSADITYFPFDTQACHLATIFWNSDDTEVTMQLESSEVGSSSYLPNGEWDLIGSTASLQPMVTCCPTVTVSLLMYEMQFKRKTAYYTINLLLPSLFMSICIIWTFLIPVESGDRLGYAITIMLTYTVLMTLTTDFLPSTSTQIPHLGFYLLSVFVASLISVSIAVVGVKLNHLHGTPPSWVKKLTKVGGMIVFFKCCRNKNNTEVIPIAPSSQTHKIEILKNGNKNQTNQAPPDKSSSSESDDVTEPEVTWRTVSDLIDRFCLVNFFISVCVSNIVLIAALVGGPM